MTQARRPARRPAPARRKPVRAVRPVPQSHPALPHPEAVPRVPVTVAPDIGLAQPTGFAGGPPLPASGGFGPKPPATVGHWLGGAGSHLVAGPAMLAVATEMHKMGYFARRQAGHTWQHIHDLKTTIR